MSREEEQALASARYYALVRALRDMKVLDTPFARFRDELDDEYGDGKYLTPSMVDYIADRLILEQSKMP